MTVKELENVGIIREVYLEKNKNKHTSCIVYILLNEDATIFELTKKIGISVVVEDDKRIYMRGTIREISSNRTFSGTKAVVKIVSHSDKVDREKKYRIFQNTKKKYKDIVSSLDNSDCFFQIMDKELAELEEELVIIQKEQTDFEFVKFIASKYGKNIFVNDTDQKCIINIGQSLGKSQKKLTDAEIIFESINVTEEKEEVIITTHEYMELGQNIIYEAQEYVIVSVSADYKNYITTFKYVLERTLCEKKEENYFDIRLGRAKVISNQDSEKLGRIQLSFLDYEDCCKDNQIWATYINTFTEKEEGIVLIPDVGEVVSVVCVNGQCYADGCIREMALAEKISDVKNRAIMFGNKLVSITNDKMEMEVFSYKVSIEENNLTISNNNNLIEMDNEKLIWKNGKTKINLNENTIQLLADEKIEFKADKINMDGRSKIVAKTSSFDVG